MFSFSIKEKVLSIVYITKEMKISHYTAAEATSLTPIVIESSVGNFIINLLPAFSSEAFSGLTRHTTLILHSSASGGAAGSSAISKGCFFRLPKQEMS